MPRADSGKPLDSFSGAIGQGVTRLTSESYLGGLSPACFRSEILGWRIESLSLGDGGRGIRRWEWRRRRWCVAVRIRVGTRFAVHVLVKIQADLIEIKADIRKILHP